MGASVVSDTCELGAGNLDMLTSPAVNLGAGQLHLELFLRPGPLFSVQHHPLPSPRARAGNTDPRHGYKSIKEAIAMKKMCQISLILLVVAGCSKPRVGDVCEGECTEGAVCLSKKCVSSQLWEELVAKCELDAMCRNEGECTPLDREKCALTSSEDCRKSLHCKTNGRCTFKDGACIATSDQDCNAASMRKWMGDMVAKDGKCVPSE